MNGAIVQQTKLEADAKQTTIDVAQTGTYFVVFMNTKDKTYGLARLQNTIAFKQ